MPQQSGKVVRTMVTSVISNLCHGGMASPEASLFNLNSVANQRQCDQSLICNGAADTQTELGMGFRF